MKKILLYLFVLQTFLHACATCQFMIPTAEVTLNLPIENNRLQKIEVQWYFSDLYTSELTIQYDKNNNQELDTNELEVILKAKLAYLLPKNMVTLVKYGNDANEQTLSPKYHNFRIKVVDKRLLFSFDMIVDIEIKEHHVLSFLFEDDESFFSFIVHEVKIPKENIHYEQNLYLFSAAILFSYEPFETLQEQNTTQSTKTLNQEETLSQDDSTQESLLKKTIATMKELFDEAQRDHEPFTYLLILFFAYIYGVVHAIGPGHGKTLVASYFLSHEKSYSKAFFISLAIGIVHTFSAFFLTLVIYFIIETFLAQFMEDTIFITTKISALIIIAIALTLFYKKYKAYKTLKQQYAFHFTTTPHVATCGCAACKIDKNTTDFALIVSAGIIPCPGTVTVFIFSLSLGLYFLGFLSAFVMSLGMSTIIFASALLSVMVRKKTSSSSTNLQKYLEYGSLLIILALGVFLLLQG